ncbi:MAG: hypothetical protein AAF916_08840 [Planctomycetota bacterium]
MKSFGVALAISILACPVSALLISPRLEYRHDATAVLPPPSPGLPSVQDRDLLEDTAFGFGENQWVATGQIGISEAEVTVDATINPTQILLDGELSFSTNNGESASASTRNSLFFRLDQPAQITYTGDLAVGAGRFAFATFSLFDETRRTSIDSVVLSDGDSSNLGGTFQLEPGRYFIGLNANQNTQRSGNTYIVREGTASFSLNAIVAAIGGQAGDFDGGGQVEQNDLNLVLNNWGGPRGDWMNAGDFATALVDQEELNAVLNNWGSSTAPSLASNPGAVPEPAWAALLGLGLIGSRSRRA